ncbi:MAG: hypothetical protein N3B13_08045, partial [Deltaproteobacteria bacterium]|nr:hypothetical protein [Deltaproteobacteria bacterium]
MERIDVSKLAENVRKLLQPDTPSGLKMLAIKGTVPLKPSDYIVFLYMMLSDSDEGIRNLASDTFAHLPQKTLSGVVSQPIPAEVIHRLAIEYRSDRNVIEKILMNIATSDETYEMIASFADEKLIDIIARNQVRILRYPNIIKAICGNPNASVSQKSMVIEFARKSGIKVETTAIGEEPEEKGESDQTDSKLSECTSASAKALSEKEVVESEMNTVTEEKKELSPADNASEKEELIKKYGIDKEYYDENIPLSEEKEKALIEELEKMPEEKQMAFVKVGRHRVKQIMARST